VEVTNSPVKRTRCSRKRVRSSDSDVVVKRSCKRVAVKKNVVKDKNETIEAAILNETMVCNKEARTPDQEPERCSKRKRKVTEKYKSYLDMMTDESMTLLANVACQLQMDDMKQGVATQGESEEETNARTFDMYSASYIVSPGVEFEHCQLVYQLMKESQKFQHAAVPPSKAAPKKVATNAPRAQPVAPPKKAKAPKKAAPKKAKASKKAKAPKKKNSSVKSKAVTIISKPIQKTTPPPSGRISRRKGVPTHSYR